MKSLFIYYSHTGNGELVKEYFESKGVDIRKVNPKHHLPKSFFFSILTGGFLSGIKHKSKLVDFDNNIDDYDQIIIGSPIWNGDFSAPINRVLSLLVLSNKKVIFVLYSGSGESPKIAKRLKKDLSGSLVINLKEPKKYKEELTKLEAISL